MDFAPVVRGIAETNARVTVRQRGVLLDEVSVRPGPSCSTTCFHTGYGDLTVTITEADGRQREFIVPFRRLTPACCVRAITVTPDVDQLGEIGLRRHPS